MMETGIAAAKAKLGEIAAQPAPAAGRTAEKGVGAA
jgi:hypothetical protein